MTAARIGVLADVQFGDKARKEDRDYRGALGRLEATLAEVARAEPDLVVQLGDLVDGYREDAARTAEDLERALAPLEALGRPLGHVVGNHELRAGRGALLARYGLGAGWWSRDVGAWRLVALDTCDVSVVGRAEEDPVARRAREWIDAHADAANARSYNGAVGEAQLAWLEGELAAARAAGRPVLAVGHHPLVPAAARAKFLGWNGGEVAARLAAGGATAYLAGHDHRGGEAMVDGVWHATLPAVLVRPAWLVLELAEDGLVARGAFRRDLVPRR